MAGKVTKMEIGTVYQKIANGSCYFRYQVNGQRKAISLKIIPKDIVKSFSDFIIFTP